MRGFPVGVCTQRTAGKSERTADRKIGSVLNTIQRMYHISSILPVGSCNFRKTAKAAALGLYLCMGGFAEAVASFLKIFFSIDGIVFLYLQDY